MLGYFLLGIETAMYHPMYRAYSAIDRHRTIYDFSFEKYSRSRDKLGQGLAKSCRCASRPVGALVDRRAFVSKHIK